MMNKARKTSAKVAVSKQAANQLPAKTAEKPKAAKKTGKNKSGSGCC